MTLPAGCGFYLLRHVHRTVTDELKDTPASMVVMGHADGTINAYYRELVGDGRLRRSSTMCGPGYSPADRPTATATSLAARLRSDTMRPDRAPRCNAVKVSGSEAGTRVPGFRA